MMESMRFKNTDEVVGSVISKYTACKESEDSVVIDHCYAGE